MPRQRPHWPPRIVHIAAEGCGGLRADRCPRPAGMERLFPANMLSMMTLAGSKGSKTNASQMAVHLGQQSFGGLRVHNMVTGVLGA